MPPTKQKVKKNNSAPKNVQSKQNSKHGSNKDVLPYREIKGYRVIPIKYTETCIHYMYAKRHTGPIPGFDQKPNLNEEEDSSITETIAQDNRTMFLVNIPPDSTEIKLRLLFKPFGRVHKVVFPNSKASNNPGPEIDSNVEKANLKKMSKSKKAKYKQQIAEQQNAVRELSSVEMSSLLASGSCAYVIFVDSAEVDNIICSPLSKNSSTLVKGEFIWPKVSDLEKVPTWSSAQALGIEYYLYEYRGLRPPLELLKKETSLFMQKFESAAYETYKKQKAIEELGGQPDEDGFVTVSYKKQKSNLNSSILSQTPHAASSHFKSAIETKTKKSEMQNFYRWQQRETNKKMVDNLKAQFEADKAKITAFRASRKFKPY
ncbi:hypothetical protein BB560_001840 [Smittium megazygosporum]|uniref:Ribosomal RNA-processing protein 7 C-terminal domain-containing protein n=1 Tax=Smittium megazygosporum TaxID=133381 RepID=A0A2T9ZGF2_9FUNG|nr:hypothetical protein BB560_001840 [Smittium megazygosporum]